MACKNYTCLSCSKLAAAGRAERAQVNRQQDKWLNCHYTPLNSTALHTGSNMAPISFLGGTPICCSICYTLHTLLQLHAAWCVYIFCTILCVIAMQLHHEVSLDKWVFLATPTSPHPASLPQRSALGTKPTQTCSTHNEGMTVPAVRGTLWLCRSSR